MQKQFQYINFQQLILGLLFLLGSPTMWASELDAAREAINTMEYTTAITRLNNYLKKKPDDPVALHLLAKTYAWDNQFAQATNIYDRLLAIQPDNVNYIYGKAQALAWLEKLNDAIPLLEKAWSLQNNNPEILQSLLLTLNQSASPQHLQRKKELAKIARHRFPDHQWDLILNE